MRALELLRHELHSISKYQELNAIQQISVVMRRNLINTMLYVVKEYEVNSAACFEAIEVLDIIKIAFDDYDIETLKDYVKRNLADSKTTHYMFESGRHTNHCNVATIVKIGIALKRLLNAAAGAQGTAGTSQDKDDAYEFHMLDEEEKAQKSAAPSVSSSAASKSYIHLNDPEWKRFCDGRLLHYETKWTKKLEDYSELDNEEIVSDKDEEEEVKAAAAVVHGDDQEEGLRHYDADAEEAGGSRGLSKS